jgi:hypothetical protein
VVGEERLPLFAMSYVPTDKRRRLLAGLIPVSKREAYMGASQEDDVVVPEAGFTLPQTRLGSLFMADVVSPWSALAEHAWVVEEGLLATPISAVDSDGAALASDAARVMPSTRNSLQSSSWYVLLDFAKFLAAYAPAVLAHADDGSVALSPAELALFNALDGISLSQNLGDALDALVGQTCSESSTPSITCLQRIHADFEVERSLLAALNKVLAAAPGLEAVDTELDLSQARGDWPGFVLPLAHPGVQVAAGGVSNSAALRGPHPTPPASVTGLEGLLDSIVTLVPLVDDLASAVTVPLPEIDTQFQPLDLTEPWYVIRCIYERPNCGPFEAPVISKPTAPFQLASFFDPDAPQRAVRIPMPMDISPAGLRKFQKNAKVVASDLFCGKLAKIRRLTFADLVLSVLPWPFHKDLPSVSEPGPCGKPGGPCFGLIFSLSIPIVTLCAMILLFIMVALFDMFFKWIPFLFVAIPIPGLKAKPPDG